MEVLTYISCIDTVYVREVSPPPKWPEISGSGFTLHFGYRTKFLGDFFRSNPQDPLEIVLHQSEDPSSSLALCKFSLQVLMLQVEGKRLVLLILK